jgi:hypothetical protein
MALWHLTYASKEVGLDIKIANRSFINAAQFIYLGTTVSNPNLIQEEIERGLNSGNACYHSVQNILSFCLLNKNVKIRIYKTIIFPVVLTGCETWFLTLREELRMFENRVLRRIFEPTTDEVTGGWKNCMRSLITCTLRQVQLE